MVQSLIVGVIVAISAAWVIWRVALPAPARAWALARLGITPPKAANGCGGCCGCSSGGDGKRGVG